MEDPRRSERRVWIVIAAAALMAAACVALLAASNSGESGAELLLVGLVAPLILLGRVFPIQIAFRRRMVTDTAPLFASCLLLGPLAAAVVAGIAIAAAEVITGRRTRIDPRQVIFNASQALLGVAAGAFAFDLVAHGTLPAESTSIMVGVIVAGAAMLVVNDILVFCVIWAQTGIRFHRMLWDFARGRTDLPYDVALYAAGFVAALLASFHPWLLLLIAAPLPVLYRAMANQVALRQQTREAVIQLADIVDERDPYTFGHCKRVSEFTNELCRQLGLSHDLTEEIVLAARVHDVGKIGIRDAVLLKPARLTEEEFAHIKEHPDIGARLTARFPDFARGTRYIRHHHEKWDGSGYPSALKGTEIPLGARIIAVADTFDAITSNRVYRDGLPDDFARTEMARVAGTQLDPEVVHAWFSNRAWEWPESLAATPVLGAIVNDKAA
ncbi:MAG: HD-GYP domain-containing protein [bacterium]